MLLKTSLVDLVQKLLERNKISFDKTELAFQIQSHPSYPSLHAITGVLDHFNIENIAAEVPANTETLQQLPDCFIAQIKEPDGQQLVVVEKKHPACTIYTTKNKKQSCSETEFLKKFTGILVAVEKPENNPKPSHTNHKYIALSIISLFTFLLLYHFNFEIVRIEIEFIF